MLETPEISHVRDPESIPNGSILFVGSHYRKGVYHAVAAMWGEAECKSRDIRFSVRGKGVMGRGYYEIIDRTIYQEKEYFVCQKVDIKRDELKRDKVEIIGGYFMLKIQAGRTYHVVSLN